MAGGAACVAKTAAQESSRCDYRCCYSLLASIEWEHVQGTKYQSSTTRECHATILSGMHENKSCMLEDTRRVRGYIITRYHGIKASSRNKVQSQASPQCIHLSFCEHRKRHQSARARAVVPAIRERREGHDARLPPLGGRAGEAGVHNDGTGVCSPFALTWCTPGMMEQASGMQETRRGECASGMTEQASGMQETRWGFRHDGTGFRHAGNQVGRVCFRHEGTGFRHARNQVGRA
jgi:hypothetical protein